MICKTHRKRIDIVPEECHECRMDRIYAEIAAVVSSGKCPLCGAGLRRNLSLTGWWQCEQYGSPGFRKNNSLPECSWQGFTE